MMIRVEMQVHSVIHLGAPASVVYQFKVKRTQTTTAHNMIMQKLRGFDHRYNMPPTHV